MRPLTVVLDAPGRDLPPRVEQVPEPTHVQTLVAQPAVKTFHVRVLRGLARLDVNGVDPPFDAPGEVMARGHLRPLLLRIASGAPRVSMIAANTLVTRRLGMNVSTSSVKHSRV